MKLKKANSTKKFRRKQKNFLAKMEPPKGDELYKLLWKVVDGEIRDCFRHHPNYIQFVDTKINEKNVRTSITKRIVGKFKALLETAEGPLVRTVKRRVESDILF